MKRIINILVLTVLFIAAKAWELPSEKCRLEDSKCLTSAVRNVVPIFFHGIPELGVTKAGALDKISFELSGLKFSLINAITDIQNINVDSVIWNSEKKYMDIDYHIDCTVKGHYTAQGKVLILAIDGDGDMEIILKNFASKFRIFYEMEKLSDGKDHVKPTKYSVEFNPLGGVEFKMTNLFNGNQELGDAVLKFINEHWKEVTNEFGKPIVDEFTKGIFLNTVKFFKLLPLEVIAIV